ncbi:hypothetical protein BU24DRAFT_481469 [Aaosphaeria arxii CBS 175.79]|uniref:ALDH-like protein n=1 Tax=Aaosphaeria arxii CBS 175.79 TaxID=1450172 RepID=A0A6A5XLE4_9PLEO|nr:uncharacterized protein BU24DRAFT_481469 [Aaosphaeria arxii CBS 175.79]KAF2014098.1 hypothetical protein BU24DRAFT_481469 [Aaosphaeria arxii CBS 175.79]
MSNPQNATLARVKGAAIDGRLRVLRIRQQLFHSLHGALIQRREELLQTIQNDDNCSAEEALVVYGSSLIDLRNHYNALDLSTGLQEEYRLARKESNENKRTPIAMTYIIPGRFALFFSLISALCAAIEAGSCVIVEFQDTTIKTPSLLQEIIHTSLDLEAFAIVSDRAPAEYLAQCVVIDQSNAITAEDVFPRRTLSSPISRSIAFVDRTSDIELAAQEIVASRSAFGGNSPYAVDLVIVNEFVLEKFNIAATKALQSIREAQKLHQLPKEPSHRVKISNNKIFDDANRDDNLQWVSGIKMNRSHQLARTKVPSSRIVLVHSVTSLDDSIDFLGTDAQQEIPIATLYLFSGEREAKYLSQYIVSQATYVNHIPAQLVVGPRTPFDYAINLHQRYTRDMFEFPSPQIVPSKRSHLTSTIFTKASFIDSVAREALKDIRQPKSGAWGFFEQGIVIGAFVYLLPMFSITITGVGYGVWRAYWSIRS